jgi:hypothetical protein
MSGLYLHIPFCKKACTYCDFHFSTSLQTKPAVLEAMHKELAQRAAELNGAPVETIYFGGGTPSQLTDTELKAFIDEAQALFTVTPDAEVTMEVNPDDVDAERLAAWKAIGITRWLFAMPVLADAFVAPGADQAQIGIVFEMLNAWAGGIGESFSSWNSIIPANSPGAQAGSWTARRNTASGGIQAISRRERSSSRQSRDTTWIGNALSAATSHWPAGAALPLLTANW